MMIFVAKNLNLSSDTELVNLGSYNQIIDNYYYLVSIGIAGYLFPSMPVC